MGGEPTDQLDIERPAALLAYLRDTGRVTADEDVQMKTLAGGVSNRTVLVERGGEAWVIKQALAKLRVEADWFADPARIHREALGLRWLHELLPAGSVPGFVFEDVAHHLFAMQAVPQPHENWKTMLLAGQIVDAHVDAFAAMLGQMHRRAFARRDEIARAFDDRSFFESLRLEPYYTYTATQVAEAGDFLHGLISDTRMRRITLVHGDYSPKNILIAANKPVLLDHEVIHFGDPAFDLGFSMTHLLSKAHHVTDRRDAFAAAALRYWRGYRGALGEVPWGGDLEAFVARHTLACLLARVCGRSPLEYMSAGQRRRQRAAVVELMRAAPCTVEQLVSRFIESL